MIYSSVLEHSTEHSTTGTHNKKMSLQFISLWPFQVPRDRIGALANREADGEHPQQASGDGSQG